MKTFTSADLNLRFVARSVADRMRAHCSGIEGMEDSDVAVWERVLRSALDEIDECSRIGSNHVSLTSGDFALRFAVRTVVEDIRKKCAGTSGPSIEWHDSLIAALLKAYESAA